MGLDTLALRAIVAVAAALLMCGVFGAWVSTNAAKRIAAVTIAMLGAVLGAAGLGAPTPLLIAGAAIGFVQLAVGAAVVVRLQESYGSIEAPEINAADARDDAGPAA
jgi:hypothetical protein